MSSHSLSRKDFMVLTFSLAGSSALVAAGCGGDDDGDGGAGAGTGGTSGASGAGTGGTTAGAGGTAAGSGGAAAGSGGTTAGAGGSTAGTGGSTAGSGGTTTGGGGTGGSGGAAAGAAGKAGGAGAGGTAAGAGGGGGMMCTGMVIFDQTSNNQHDHLNADPGTAQTMDAFGPTQVNAGNAITLILTGDGHTHELMLTAQDLMNLRNGMMVTGKVSGPRREPMGQDMHTHTYTIRCGT